MFANQKRPEMALAEPFPSLKTDLIRPMPTSFVTIPVAINVNAEVFVEYSDAFIEVIKAEMGYRNGRVPETVNKVKQYLQNAVAARVQQCRRGKVDVNWKRHDEFCVPAFLAVALAQVGVASDASIGVTLEPVLTGDFEVMSYEDLREVSAFLANMERVLGIEVMHGLPKSGNGSWAFMSMEFTEDAVVNHSALHPRGMAVIAAFFAVEGISKVLGMGRVLYITSDQVRNLLREVQYVKG